MIKTYNNDRKTKDLPEIPHSEELARKISKLRFDYNKKIKVLKNMDIVVNIAELKAEVARKSFRTQELSAFREHSICCWKLF